MVDVTLCFASYEEKKGMYKNLSVNLENFDKEEIENLLIEYYESINIEEFFLADVWTDDNDVINNIIVKNYTECYQTMFKFLEGLKDNLEDINLTCFEIACEQNSYSNSYCEDMNYLVNYSENINIIYDVWDYFEECVNIEKSELATRLFQLQNDREAVEALRKLGYIINESECGVIFEDLN